MPPCYLATPEQVAERAHWTGSLQHVHAAMVDEIVSTSWKRYKDSLPEFMQRVCADEAPLEYFQQEYWTSVAQVVASTHPRQTLEEAVPHTPSSSLPFSPLVPVNHLACAGEIATRDMWVAASRGAGRKNTNMKLKRVSPIQPTPLQTRRRLSD